MEKVKLEARDGGLRVITLNDPVRRNVLNTELCADLLQAVRVVQTDSGARALVVAAEGTVFCGGADMPGVFGDQTRSVAQIRDDLHAVYASFLAIRELKIPTISAVQGPAIGAGLNLAMVCDIRVAGPDAQFAATFSRIGLHPGGGCTWFLVQAMGSTNALKMLLEGGSKSGADAVGSGLATVFTEDPLAEALRLGDCYAQLDSQLSRDIKTAVHIASTSDFASTLEFESWAQASAATKPQLRRYVERFRK